MTSSQYYIVRRGSTSLSNHVILSGLSYEALGLLMTELSLKPGTPLGYRNMVGRGAGEARVRKAHKELEAAGFRHQFLTRTAAGALKTLTVVTDEPMHSEDVIDDIDFPDGCYVVKIQTIGEPTLPQYQPPQVLGSGRKTCRSHRAVKNTARCDQGKHTPEITTTTEKVSEQEKDTKTAGRTVPWVTAARLTTAGRSPNTLRVKESSTPSPNPSKATAWPTTQQGQEKAGIPSKNQPHGRQDTSLPKAYSPEDSQLIHEVLPAQMQAIPPRDYKKIADTIRLRLAAGWDKAQITALLTSRCLPSRIRHLTALILARFRDDIPLTPPVVINQKQDEFNWRTSDGKTVKRYDIDWSKVLNWHKQALADGTTTETHRSRFLMDMTGGIVDKVLI